MEFEVKITGSGTRLEMIGNLRSILKELEEATDDDLISERGLFESEYDYLILQVNELTP